MERVEALEDEVGRLNELMQELEVDSMAKQVHLSCDHFDLNHHSCDQLRLDVTYVTISVISHGNHQRQYAATGQLRSFPSCFLRSKWRTMWRS